MDTVTPTPAAPVLAPRLDASSERRFFTGMAVAILATVFVGFGPTFFLKPLFPDAPVPPERFFMLHGAVFSGWIALFVAQAYLVGTGRTALHRRIGPWGAALAVAVVALGTLGALIAARRTTGFVGVPVPPLQFLAIPLFDMVMFTTFVSIAFATRRNPQAHKRWMLLATVNLITAAIARWPGVLPMGPLAFFGLTDLFIVALVVWDLRSRGRPHAATVWGGALTIAGQGARLAVMGTGAWLAFAGWATGLLD